MDNRRVNAFWMHVDAPMIQRYRALMQLLDVKGYAERAAISHFARLICIYNTERLKFIPGQAQASCTMSDFSTVQADTLGTYCLRRAWATVCQSSKWSHTYRKKVSTSMGKIMQLVCKDLAYIVNPVARRSLPSTANAASVVTCERSFERTFQIHDVLPIHIRLHAAGTLKYDFIVYLGQRMAECLQSVSKHHMRAICSLLERLVYQVPSVLSDTWSTVAECMQELRRHDATFWLCRFGKICAQRKHNRKNQHSNSDFISFDHFRRHLRYLSIFYVKVCRPGAPDPIPVPAPRSSTRSGQNWMDSGLSTTSMSEESADTGVRSRIHLREMVWNLRNLYTRRLDPLEEASRVYAFTPDEVERMISTADTVLDKLVLMLFMHTGMRIGGVCRLQLKELPTPTGRQQMFRGSDMPSKVITVEKGNKGRVVRLPDVCRLLLAQWYNSKGRRLLDKQISCKYIFPGYHDAAGNASTRWIWTICRRLFLNAGVTGRHVHPHTFRHTVIQMLHQNGMNFEQIGLWIGHESFRTTAGTYGHVPADTLAETVVHTLSGQGYSNSTQKWKQVLRLLLHGYTFRNEEYGNLKNYEKLSDGVVEVGQAHIVHQIALEVTKQLESRRATIV